MESMIKSHIRDVPDFPKPGIVFKDITPVLENADLFKKVIDHFTQRYRGKQVSHIIGVESRGFIFAAALAYALGCGFVPVRKKGKLPYDTHEVSYDLEYGSATVEMHVDALTQGSRVVVMDDLLATGGTAAATCRLVEKLGASVVEVAMLVELSFLNGRTQLGKYPVYTMVKY